MNLTKEQLIAIFPYAHDHALYAQVIQTAWDRFDFKTKAARASFCGIIGNETGGLRTIGRENLNYTHEQALMYFTKARQHPDTCRDRCSRGAEAFGSWIYADLYGNGDEASKDGFIFRGGGMVQTTFRSTYRATGAGIGIDLEAAPHKIIEPSAASLSATWFMAVYKPTILQLFNTGEVGDFLTAGSLVGWTNPHHTKIRMDYRQKALDVLDGDAPIVSTGHRILRVGVPVGGDVSKLQTMLADRGLYSGDIDGDFGEMTRQAVLKFQRMMFTLPHDIDGVVGEKTWRLLENHT